MSINPINATLLMRTLSEDLRNRLIEANRDKVIDLRYRYRRSKNETDDREH
jgi:hypothetical protein